MWQLKGSSEVHDRMRLTSQLQHANAVLEIRRGRVDLKTLLKLYQMLDRKRQLVLIHPNHDGLSVDGLIHGFRLGP